MAIYTSISVVADDDYDRPRVERSASKDEADRPWVHLRFGRLSLTIREEDACRLHASLGEVLGESARVADLEAVKKRAEEVRAHWTVVDLDAAAHYIATGEK
jgi:hypothetical protein